MNFDGIDAAFVPEARGPVLLYPDAIDLVPRVALEQAVRLGKEMPPPTLQEALAQVPSCGCTRGASGAGQTAPLVQASVAIDALLSEHEREYSRTDVLGGRAYRAPEIEAALSVESIGMSDPRLTKEVGPQSTTLDGGGDGTTWVDSNGNGYWDPEDEIIVTGSTGRKADDEPDWTWYLGDGSLGGGDGIGTGTGGGAGGEVPAPTPPDMECLTEEEKSQLSEKEREAYEAAEVAAKIFREIMEKPDRDIYEYGAIIYRDAEGVIRHTAVRRGSPTGVTLDETGLPGYGDIIAIIHLHTAATWTGDDFKLFAKPGENGDWSTFDWYAGRAYIDLLTRGFTPEEASARVASMHQFIIGPKGPIGSNLYEMRKYEFNDRDLATLGQKIPQNLGQCS